jgi:hypothetical protein
MVRKKVASTCKFELIFSLPHLVEAKRRGFDPPFGTNRCLICYDYF